MKLQLKRSNVLSKAPTAGQMEYGELAVNYNEADPAVYMKDTNNNVIRISGIGNISDDGLTEVPSDNVAPPNPVSGNLWFNADEGRLYIYYIDENSEQWVDASPDNWSASVLPDITDPSDQPGSLDDRYVSKVATTSQDMVGDLTLGTDKITLDAGDGTASFAGEVEANGGLEAYIPTNNLASFSQRWFDDKYSTRGLVAAMGVAGQFWTRNSVGVGGTSANDYAAAINNDGSAFFGGSVSTDSYYTVDRDVTPGTGALYLGFTQGVQKFKVGTEGDVTSGDFSNVAGTGSLLSSTGAVMVRQQQEVGVIWNGLLGGMPTSQIFGDGSASFASTIEVQDGVSGVSTSASDALTIETSDVTSKTRGIGIYGKSSIPTTYEAIQIRHGGNQNITIKYDGSASFASTVSVTNDTANNAWGVKVINNDGRSGRGSFRAQNMGGGELFTGVNADASETVAVINSDGSASFASGGFAIDGSGTVQTNINSAGNIKLDSTGDFNDPNIFLKATDGSASFSGTLTVDENINGLKAVSGSGTATQPVLRVYSDTLSAYTTNLNADGSATFAGVVTGKGVTLKPTDPSGGLYVMETDGTTQAANVLADGSATFASTVQSGGAPYLGVVGSQLQSAGVVSACRPTGFGIWYGYKEGSSAETSEITADGNATFTGRVNAGSSAITSDVALKVESDNGATSTGSIYVQQNNSAGNVFVGRNASGPTSFIGADGNATFGSGYKVKIRPFDGDGADQIWIEKTNGSKPFVVTGAGGIIANDNIAISRTLGTSACYVGQLNGADTSYIHASGEASFSGTVSTDSYYTVDRNVTPGTSALYLGFTQGVQKFKVATDGTVTSGDFSNVAGTGSLLAPGGAVMARQQDGNGILWNGLLGNTATSQISGDGNATFSGTVTANGSVLTRVSGDLDVGDRLEKADAALQTLKTAAAASTDFASLKSAIATALANI